MAFSFKRINGPLLLVHFLAIPCFIIGSQLLEKIRWIPMREAYRTGGDDELIQAMAGAGELSGTLARMYSGPLYAWLAAIVLGCVLSALVVHHRRENWALPAVLFGLAIVTSWTHYYESQPVKHGLSYLLHLVARVSYQTQLCLVGGMLLVLGLVPFLLTWSRPALTAKTIG
jgi:hypothetical protein